MYYIIMRLSKSDKSQFQRFGIQLFDVLDYYVNNVIYKHTFRLRILVNDNFDKVLPDDMTELNRDKKCHRREVLGCS